MIARTQLPHYHGQNDHGQNVDIFWAPLSQSYFKYPEVEGEPGQSSHKTDPSQNDNMGRMGRMGQRP